MRVYFDNTCSPRLAKALRVFFEGEHEVDHPRIRFGTGAVDDEVWLPLLGEESRSDSRERAWIVITEDLAILSKTARSGSTRRAWEEAGLRTFFLPKAAKKRPFEQLRLILKNWDAILAHAASMDPRRAVLIPETGTRFKPLD